MTMEQPPLEEPAEGRDYTDEEIEHQTGNGDQQIDDGVVGVDPDISAGDEGLQDDV